MKISVAMATYNGAVYLREQLDSLVHQTRPPDELVISDDCSTDDTWRQIEAFAAEAPFPVRTHRNDANLGYAGNFEQALGRCAGDLVFLCDQDDVWFPEKIEAIAAIAETDRYHVAFMNDASITDDTLADTGLTKLGQIRGAGMPDSAFVMGCCAAIRKEFLDLCLPVPAAYASHDSWIMNLADGIGRRRILESRLQWYRRHAANESWMAANRTRRLGVLGYWLDRARAVRREGSAQRIGAVLDRTRLLREKAESLALGNHIWREAFQEYAESLRERETAARLRMAACTRPRHARLWPTVSLYAKGQYRHFGVTNLLRDLLFK